MAGTPYARDCAWTAVVYRTLLRPIATSPLSLHQMPYSLAETKGLCYNPRPEAAGVGVTAPVQYRSHYSVPLNTTVDRNANAQHRFHISGSTGCWISDGYAPPACGNPV